MNREEFNAIVNKYLRVIDAFKDEACYIHDVECNQKYGNEPYSVHLKMVGAFAKTYGHLVCDKKDDVVPMLFGAYFHDAIEDARMTYNDIFKLSKCYMSKEQATMATELVYALTDEKGRNREERGSEKHYEDIKKTPYAPFVKWCDRYANYVHSVNTKSRMATVYRREMPNFIKKIGGTKYIPQELIDEIINYNQNVEGEE